MVAPTPQGQAGHRVYAGGRLGGEQEADLVGVELPAPALGGGQPRSRGVVLGVRVTPQRRVRVGHEAVPGDDGLVAGVGGRQLEHALVADGGLQHVDALARRAQDLLPGETAPAVQAGRAEDEVHGRVLADLRAGDAEVSLCIEVEEIVEVGAHRRAAGGHLVGRLAHPRMPAVLVQEAVARAPAPVRVEGGVVGSPRGVEE